MQVESLLHFGAGDNPKVTSPAVEEVRAEWAILSGRRVLIVEDEALQALTMAQLVIELGARVAGVATSVQGALAEIATTDFDVVTLDLNMGGMFSLGIAQGLRNMRVPFVFCTAYGHVIQEFAGAPVVQKPFTKEELAEGLVRALAGRYPQ